MKKFLSIFLTLIFIFCFVGCTEKAEAKKSDEIIINMPKDNTVNGYREDNNSSKLPSVIEGDKVVAGNVQTNQTSLSYCGNKNSKIFHNLTCSSLKSMKEENRINFATREEYVNNGYTPCKKCNP